MITFVVLIAILGTASAVPAEATPAKTKGMTPEQRACYNLLQPIGATGSSAMKSCVAQQPDLDTTIDQLRHSPNASSAHPLTASVTQLLHDAGKDTEANLIKICLATADGKVVIGEFGKKTYNVAALKERISSKVEGTNAQKNTQLGLDNCPVEPLTNFNPTEYMRCIKSYCTTGAAPPADSAPASP